MECCNRVHGTLAMQPAAYVDIVWLFKVQSSACGDAVVSVIAHDDRPV